MSHDLRAPQLVAIPAGQFLMGESPGDKFANDTERPAHLVQLRPFALGRFAVTVGEYRAFAASHAPYDDAALPVVNVSWNDARAYCAWLGGSCRLPSETEWEFACRAGSTTPFAFGGEITPREANYYYSESGERVGRGRRTTCGEFPANAFGLHDLHGNVCEWVEDVWHADYHGAPQDSSAWVAAGDPARRVIRGGAWDYLPRLLRSAWRDGLGVDRRRDNVGFRVASSDLPA
ncbi:MAG: formylglycine-generating enzyme family protein [Chthoniobacter sp.]|uniref:formylglycine-generating enzyme family protein n=1 Tax=Chthoniobacter sp. TaxID=2510640 RepID=UPI0032A9994A